MTPVRDFLYLSDQKLRALDVKISRLQRGTLAMRGEVKLPFMSVAVEPTAQTAQSTPDRGTALQAARLRKAIDDINERSLWYSDPEARAGCWVYFESPMNYCLLQSKYFQSSVIFADHAGVLPDPTVRLLMHGAQRHLLNQPRVIEVSDEVERLRSASSGTEFVYALADNIADVIRAISAANDPLAATPAHIPSVTKAESLATGIARILRVLDQRFAPDTAATLAGLARVTASMDATDALGNTERFIMATPLYVEYKNLG